MSSLKCKAIVTVHFGFNQACIFSYNNRTPPLQISPRRGVGLGGTVEEGNNDGGAWGRSGGTRLRVTTIELGFGGYRGSDHHRS
jgi:hypothetical protein